MNNEWQTAKVAEIAATVAMGPFGSNIKVSCFVPDGVPIISGQHLHNFSMTDKDFNFVTEEKAEQLKNSNAYRGDIIFTHAGNIGNLSIIPENSQYTRYVMSQRQFKLTVKKDVVDSRFLTWFFRSPAGQHLLLANTSQTGVPSIARPVTYLRSIEVPIPPLPEQRAIARVLGALDDKIELNRRMNQTLEAIARALFQSWFVDFDPVRAKADGRTPDGMDAETAALFPDAFEDTAAGRIPAGWEFASLAHIASLSKIGLNPADFPDEEFDHFSLPAFDEGQMPKSEKGALIKSNKFVVKPGSVLMSKLNPHIPRIWLPCLNPEQRAIASTEFLVLEPHEPEKQPFLYCLLKSENFGLTFASQVTGTSGSHQRVKPNDVLIQKVVLPPARLIGQFGEVVGAMLDQMAAYRDQSQTLAALRDALLPKLLSGAVRVNVRDEEREAGEETDGGEAAGGRAKGGAA